MVPWLLSIMRTSHGVYSTLACQALLPMLESPALRSDAVNKGAGPALANCLKGIVLGVGVGGSRNLQKLQRQSILVLFANAWFVRAIT